MNESYSKTDKISNTQPLRRGLFHAATKGWRIFPTIGKVPLTPRGFKDASDDQEQIAEWLRQKPDANYGIATGPESGLYVLDEDPKSGGSIEQWLQRIGKTLPETFEVRTPSGGRHFYFAYPSGAILKNTASKLDKGLDSRGLGGYVIGPGSLNYEVINDIPPAELPEWLIAELEAKPGPGRFVSNVTPLADPEGKIRSGRRSDTLARYAGSMRRKGMAVQEIDAALQVINSGRCEPPMGADEVYKIAQSVARYDPEGDLSAVDFEVEEGKKTQRAARRTSDVFEAFNALLPPDICPPDVANTLRILLGKTRGLLPGEELFFTDFEGGMLLPGDSEVDDTSVAKRWKRAIVEADEWQNEFGKRCFKRTPGTNRFIGGKTAKASTYEVALLEAVVMVSQIANGHKKPEVFAGHKRKLKRAKRFAIAAEYVRENVLPEYNPDPETQKVKGANSRKPSLVGKESRAMDRCLKAFAQMLDNAAEKGDSDVAMLIERTKHRMAETLADRGFEGMVQLLVDPALIENETPETEFSPDALSTHDKETGWTDATGHEIEPDFENAEKRFSENDNLQETNEMPEIEVDSLVQLHPVEKVRSWVEESARTGAALREIRDDELYKGEYPSFEEFCQKEFGLTLSEASELIEAAQPKGAVLSSVFFPVDLPNDTETLERWLNQSLSEGEVVELLERESVRLEGCNEPLEEIATPTSASAA